MDADITDLFNPDVIDLGIVNYNVGGVNDQLYYNEQNPNYTPFPSSALAELNPDKTLYGPLPSAYTAPTFLNGDPVPAAFMDLTNAQLYAQVRPGHRRDRRPRCPAQSGHAEVQRHPRPRVDLLAHPPALERQVHAIRGLDLHRHGHPDEGHPTTCTYKYLDPTTGKWVSVSEAPTKATKTDPRDPGDTDDAATGLERDHAHGPWHDPELPRLRRRHPADVPAHQPHHHQQHPHHDQPGRYRQRSERSSSRARSSTTVSGPGTSSNSSNLTPRTRSRTPTGPSPTFSRSPSSDFAGNVTQVVITFAVSNTSTLIKDIGRKALPTIVPSVTLISLIVGLGASTPSACDDRHRRPARDSDHDHRPIQE